VGTEGVLMNFLKRKMIDAGVFIKKQFKIFAIGYYKFYILLADFALWLVFGVLVASFITNNKFEISLLISFFGVLITIANVSFSFARSLDNDSDKKTVNFAAERLLHAAIILVYTSILRYTIIQIKLNFPDFAISNYGRYMLVLLTSCYFFFLWTLMIETSIGLNAVLKFLEPRGNILK
jgi:hypothetical protein